MGSLIATLLIVTVSFYGAVLGLQRRILYPRPAAPSRAPPLPRGSEVVMLGPRADVEAWLLRPPATEKPMPVIIFTHGNGELIDHWVSAFGWLVEAGVGVLLLEYPGYGRSGGSPTQDSITETMLAAYDHLARRPDVDAHRIVAWGRSLGGGAACVLVERRKVAALVLESSFTSVRRMASRLFVPGVLVLDPFDNLAVVEATEIPILVLHGERDEVIPIHHGEELARAAGTELIRMPCGHNDCARPIETVLRFLAEQGLR
jgi:fermentation-respiration switch protein FrsA (DUF1100 family)